MTTRGCKKLFWSLRPDHFSSRFTKSALKSTLESPAITNCSQQSLSRCHVTFRRLFSGQERSQPNNSRTTRSYVRLLGLGLLGYSGYHLLHNPVQAAQPLIRDDIRDDMRERDVETKERKKSLKDQYNFIADVVESASPAVVYIEVSGQNPWIEYKTGGSGFILTPDGQLITNAHVLMNCRKCSVKLNDGRIFEGYVEALDPTSDLATIRIKGLKNESLPTLKLGDSSHLRPGEFVVALGSPLTLKNTVTTGVVSAVQRGPEELGLRNYGTGYIQTDASINIGNSGGPLIDLNGDAVGINSMRLTDGIAFAIPSDTAKAFLQKIEIEKEKRRHKRSGFLSDSSQQMMSGSPESSPDIMTRKYLGIRMISLNEDIIRQFNQISPQSIPKDIESGVIIMKVMESSPAHQSGLQPHDIILKVNGDVVRDVSDVYRALSGPNQHLLIDVRRSNQNIRIKVVPQDIS